MQGDKEESLTPLCTCWNNAAQTYSCDVKYYLKLMKNNKNVLSYGFECIASPYRLHILYNSEDISDD